MQSAWFTHQTSVVETMLDTFGHLNHARYLTLFEDARWQLCHDKGYTLERMLREGIGFVIIEANIQYLKEVKHREDLTIRTRFLGMERKVWTIEQDMQKADGTMSATITLKAGLFDLKQRKLATPDAEWLRIFGGGA